ncbi:MAG TPA: PAS domain-containing protein, partial [Candidatus Micrarchaeota archaeon]|nr:PAS domain-containing protein [Candidatus Micrarchaeota archaeon]
MASGYGSKTVYSQLGSFYPGRLLKSRTSGAMAARKIIDRSVTSIHLDLESAQDGILVIGNDGKVASFNTEFLELWSVPEGIGQSKDYKSLMAHVMGQLAAPQEYLNRIRQLDEHPKQESYDIVLLNDGRVFERYSMPQTYGAKILGRVWIFRDITQQAKVQAVLDENEERYKVLLDSSPDSITILDAEGRILFLNKRSAARFHKSPAQLVGRLIWDFVPPKTAPFTAAAIKKAIRTGKGGAASGYIKLGKAAHWFDITLTPVRNPSGKISSVMVISVDNTERKRAEDAVRESEAHFRNLFDSVVDGVVVLDR